MTTPSVSGTFLSRPEGGMEYGVDYGASGLLGAPVYAPLSGTVVGYQTQQGWAPGRLLISTAQGLLGIGHIVSGLVPGQVINAETIEFMRKLDVKEIHGYNASLGLKLLKASFVEQLKKCSTNGKAKKGKAEAKHDLAHA